MLLVNSIHFYKKNIVAVYTFDAPGLHKELTETAGYQNMMERTKVFVPQGSIIGMMLEIPDKKKSSFEVLPWAVLPSMTPLVGRLKTNTLSN